MKAAFDGVNALTADEAVELKAVVPKIATLARTMQGLGYAHTDKSLEALARYSLGYGIGITGGVGTGKTYFFETLRTALTRLRPQAHYTLPDLRIVRLWEFSKNHIGEILDYFANLYRTDIVLDDLGCEGMFNDYGEKYFLITRLLDDRCNSIARTCWTTNLDGKGLADYYDDDRIIDRLKANGGRMIQFAGCSRRKAVRHKGLFA